MALRQAMARMATLGAASSQTTARAFGTSAMRANTDGQKESIASFMAKFEAVKPSTMDNPSVPSDFMKPAREIPATPPAKLTLNFYMPHEIEFDGVEVDQVQVPATTGDMGVLPGHVPTVVQMRPGVVAVNVNEKDVQKVCPNPLGERFRRRRARCAWFPGAKAREKPYVFPSKRRPVLKRGNHDRKRR